MSHWALVYQDVCTKLARRLQNPGGVAGEVGSEPCQAIGRSDIVQSPLFMFPNLAQAGH